MSETRADEVQRSGREVRRITVCLTRAMANRVARLKRKLDTKNRSEVIRRALEFLDEELGE